MGRCLYYGPYVLPKVAATQAHFSTFGYETSHHVSGIFFDAMTSSPGWAKTIGVTLEPTPQRAKNIPTTLSIPAFRTLEPRYFLSGNPYGAFLSKAAFAGARSLQAQKHGSRYTGLLATFEDESALTLGQWDPSQLDTISLLYSEEQGPLNTIVFILSEPLEKEGVVFRDILHQYRYVEDIVLYDTETEKACFKWGDLGAEIAWYFTSQCDIFAYWDGGTQTAGLTDSTIPYNIVDSF
ncbi:unnamed protein product [Clonostachys solani]|uniref:Uncharacterized protein n=1 Tax=Clonostachys solani TaxID=160281 RepID=A0A9N9ZD34_9HYPO|nr:unnamed protein product [Clonostachys solani]